MIFSFYSATFLHTKISQKTRIFVNVCRMPGETHLCPQYFSKLSHPVRNKTTRPPDIRSRHSIRGRNGLNFPSGSSGEHKNGAILSTMEIILAICGENTKTGQIAGRYIFPLAVFCRGCFFGRTSYRPVPDRVPGGQYGPVWASILIGVYRKIWGY